MTWGMVAVAGATLVGGYMASESAGDAADAQAGAADAGISEQRRQFDSLQKLLSPYSTAGAGALTQQQNLIGLNGNGAQQTAINGIQNSAQFRSMLQQGNKNILANASATGGLRGGNTQAALAQFSPQLLSQLIDQQYSRLGGITSLGQNAAAMQGNAGMQTGNNISNLLQQQGAAQAGGALAQGKIYSNTIGQLAGMYAGGGFGGGGGTVYDGAAGGGGLRTNSGTWGTF